jgi:putative Mg2+ transporter-C (MgtC) family protein
MPPIDGFQDSFFRLGAAGLCGVILGINRDLVGKPAGVRTHALVSLGACLLAIVAIEIATAGGQVNSDAVSRAVQGIITGIGFIGAGTILRGERRVEGLTTAASIWIAAALGVTFGAGRWAVGALALGAVLTVLLIGGAIENLFQRLLGGGDRRIVEPRPGTKHDQS